MYATFTFCFLEVSLVHVQQCTDHQKLISPTKCFRLHKYKYTNVHSTHHRACKVCAGFLNQFYGQVSWQILLACRAFPTYILMHHASWCMHATPDTSTHTHTHSQTYQKGNILQTTWMLLSPVKIWTKQNIIPKQNH